jgi:hypothetical protein
VDDRRRCSAPSAVPALAHSPRANAPLLHDETFSLLVAQLELPGRDDFSRLPIRSLDNSKPALASDAYAPNTERQRHLGRAFWTARFRHAEQYLTWNFWCCKLRHRRQGVGADPAFRQRPVLSGKEIAKG